MPEFLRTYLQSLTEAQKSLVLDWVAGVNYEAKDQREGDYTSEILVEIFDAAGGQRGPVLEGEEWL